LQTNFPELQKCKIGKASDQAPISSDSEIPSAFQNETRLADAGFRGIASLVHKLCLVFGEHPQTRDSLLESHLVELGIGPHRGSLLTGREKLQAER
jgi:hypothetical protein